jgi:hypothetical protein
MMKSRSKPHPSTPNNTLLQSKYYPEKGHWAERTDLKFRYEAHYDLTVVLTGTPDGDTHENWLRIGPKLDEYISQALVAMPPPMDSPEDFDCDWLILDSIRVLSREDFILEFGGIPATRTSQGYYEVPWAYFSANDLVKIEWVT